MSGRKGDFTAKFRKEILSINPMCVVCKIFKSTEVHHIVPLCDGGTDDETNAAALCHFCHKFVPGDTPDGYHEEFEVYKAAGGMLWHFYKKGFIRATYEIPFLNDSTEALHLEKVFREKDIALMNEMFKGRAKGPQNIQIMMS